MKQFDDQHIPPFHTIHIYNKINTQNLFLFCAFGINCIERIKQNIQHICECLCARACYVNTDKNGNIAIGKSLVSAAVFAIIIIIIMYHSSADTLNKF